MARRICHVVALLVMTWCPAFVGGASSANHAQDFGPVIAVVSQPCDCGGSIIFAWYVKWLEAQGARVVPLFYDAPREEAAALLARVNGVLFAGGPTDIIREHAEYGDFSQWVWHMALEAKLPLWGTCLGFEQMLLYSSGEKFPGPLTEGWASMEQFFPLNLTVMVPENSIFAEWPDNLKRDIETKPWTWNAHFLGVSSQDFENRPAVRNFWQVLATSVDRRGEEFIAAVQARHGIPFFATQFHPEKNANEWEIPFSNAGFTGALPAHSAGAIEAMNRIGAFYVNQTRGFRGFEFTPSEYWAASITNWSPRLSAGVHGLELFPPHEQLYIFPPRSATGAADGVTLL